MQQDGFAMGTQEGLQQLVGLQALRSGAHGGSFAMFRERATHPHVNGFAIHAAHSSHHRALAGQLVQQRYAERGYRVHQAVGASHATPELLTLSATSPEGTLGTLGIRYDSARGLNADAVFEQEMDALRSQGRILCEFTQLALDAQAASKRVLAALFHSAYLHASHLRGAELLVIEVNPRHVAYYRRMLGFKVCSEARLNPRVHAPAVLMVLEFSHIAQQIARYGGQPALATVARTLYPYAFDPVKAAEVLASLRDEAQPQIC